MNLSPSVESFGRGCLDSPCFYLCWTWLSAAWIWQDIACFNQGHRGMDNDETSERFLAVFGGMTRLGSSKSQAPSSNEVPSPKPQQAARAGVDKVVAQVSKPA